MYEEQQHVDEAPQPQEQSHAERVEQQRAEEAAREGGRGA